MRTHLFSLGVLALFVAACASSSERPAEPESKGKLAKLSLAELNATFVDYPQDGGPSQVFNLAATDLEDVNVGSEFNAGGIAPANPSSGIFFNDQDPGAAPVNFNQDIRGRFDPVGDSALGAQAEQEKIQRAGWIKLDVSTAIKFSRELRKLAATFGATVSSFKDNEVVWKMSGEKLEALIEYFDLRKDVEVLGYDFRSYDRTGDFYAIEERIKSTQKMIELLNGLLGKAEKVEDLIKISEQIERNQARLDGLNATLKEINRRSGLVEVRIVLED